jgi:hypothetical protein
MRCKPLIYQDMLLSYSKFAMAVCKPQWDGFTGQATGLHEGGLPAESDRAWSKVAWQRVV